ncbi:hypothetical protein BDB00DRAFT_840329 [Zychaea mexicana]|uniref:uncharacterized protein n=1 Tax=Zychaea mexicana TaxID=64656 RepID=UPI0022FE3EF5|nr:uncharacterized protein BDB00DRAFT_840329 [Zychaea mexicana]KAI9489974.1 hypothetical protein BDB00DRAFT_840329 [Zychaea mexicana]
MQLPFLYLSLIFFHSPALSTTPTPSPFIFHHSKPATKTTTSNYNNIPRVFLYICFIFFPFESFLLSTLVYLPFSTSSLACTNHYSLGLSFHHHHLITLTRFSEPPTVS